MLHHRSLYDESANVNIVLIITILSLILLVAERFIVAKRAESIRIRIHINGTRGKSSVARYIGAAFAAAGHQTFVKITGVVPTLFFPDGTPHPIVRRGKARLQEQVSMISQAARHNAEVLVIECMSLKPEYQLLETRIIRPHITVMTNIDDDHREEMGSSDEEHVAALSASIPFGATVITADLKHFPLLKRHAELRGTKVIAAPKLPEELISQLPEGVFHANVAVALAVTDEFGIDQQRAFAAIIAQEDQSECTHVEINGFKNRFINGFAVNDVPSAEQFIAQWDEPAAKRKKILVVNTRNDRPLRTVEFIQWCSSIREVQQIIFTGNHTPFALRKSKNGLVPVTSVRMNDADGLTNILRAIVQSETDIYGFGNIAGDGFAVIEYFRKRAV